MIQDRTERGQFAPKSDEPRRVRTIRLTDTTWEKIGYAADKRRITRADLVERMAEDGVFGDDDEAYASSLNKIELLYSALVEEVENSMNAILDDPVVTRKGKDKSAVKRGLQTLLNKLKSV